MRAMGVRTIAGGLAFLVMAGLTGCATLNSAPFKAYAAQAQQVQTSVDSAMQAGGQWARKEFLETYQGPISGLVIDFGREYDWTMESIPLPMTLKKARKALWELNQSMVVYAGLLTQLSESGFDQPDAFKNLAQQLNENTTSAAKAFQLQPPKQAVAIFSAAAVEAAGQWIRGRQIEDLRKLIAENQSTVESYSGHCVEMIHYLRNILKESYVSDYEPIKGEWQRAAQGARVPAVEKMLDLNDQVLDNLQLLEQIEAVYRAFPKAHADLEQSVRGAKPGMNWQGLQQLADEGKRLNDLYQALNSK